MVRIMSFSWAVMRFQKRFFCSFFGHRKSEDLHCLIWKNGNTSTKRQETKDRFLFPLFGHSPLHVLWQVSFGCWVTWSISSWQRYYKSVLFSQSCFWMIKFTAIQKKLFGTRQFGKIDVLVNFIISKFKRVKK